MTFPTRRPVTECCRPSIRLSVLVRAHESRTEARRNFKFVVNIRANFQTERSKFKVTGPTEFSNRWRTHYYWKRSLQRRCRRWVL